LPNVNHVFDLLDIYFSNERIAKLSATEMLTGNSEAFRYLYKEYKVHLRSIEVSDDGYEIYPVYMLSLEDKGIPKIGSKYVLRVMIHHTGIASKTTSIMQIREETLSKLGLPNSKGLPKHYWQWVNVWVGDSYELQDLGQKDADGLSNLVRKSIGETLDLLKEKMKSHYK
jgi:hypothetical protein